jgi:hypothetical protein
MGEAGVAEVRLKRARLMGQGQVVRAETGEWRVRSVLSEGGFGQIYVAEGLATGEEVAVKAEEVDAELGLLRVEECVYRSAAGTTAERRRHFLRLLGRGQAPGAAFLVL